jgi:membrane associated rhomboid family serine protease
VIPVKANIATDGFPAVTVGLIVANVVMYIVATAHGGSLISGPTAAGLARYGAVADTLAHGHRLGTALSSMFVHASIVALAVNLLFLWIFGNTIEDAMGPAPFAAFVLIGGIVAVALDVVVDPDAHGPLVGAAGMIAAAVGGYAVVYPRARTLSLVVVPYFWGVAEVPTWAMIALFAAVQVVFAATGLSGTGAPAYLDYVGGLAFGVAAIRPLATRRKPTPPTAAAYR